MQKLKEENEKHCEKLRQEIMHIKSERVKLIKQMKADNDLFRKSVPNFDFKLRQTFQTFFIKGTSKRRKKK